MQTMRLVSFYIRSKIRWYSMKSTFNTVNTFGRLRKHYWFEKKKTANTNIFFLNNSEKNKSRRLWRVKRKRWKCGKMTKIRAFYLCKTNKKKRIRVREKCFESKTRHKPTDAEKKTSSIRIEAKRYISIISTFWEQNLR